MNSAIPTRQHHERRLRLLEILDQIARISLANESMEGILSSILDLLLYTFNGDRAWLAYPCDPNAGAWTIPAERTRPEWRNRSSLATHPAISDEMSGLFAEQLSTRDAIQYLPDSDHDIPINLARLFSVKSQLAIALHPATGCAWMLGLHHCQEQKAYCTDELELFGQIAQRIADTLSNLISRKKLEATAAEMQDFYDSVPCGYHSLNERGIVQHINETELEWVGYRREDVVDKMKWSDFIASCCIKSYTANIASLIKNGSFKDVEVVLIHKDGSPFHGLLSTTAIFDADRRYAGNRAVLINIDSLKQSERQLHALTARLHDAIEEEKTQISREIHDELGGTMAAIKFEAHWLKSALAQISASSLAREHTETMSRLIDHASASMRNIVAGLRPTAIEDLGFLAALEWKAVQFEKRTGIRCRVNCIANKGDLEKQLAIALYRIAQEALTNVAKHSGASMVDIEYLHSDEEIMLSVIDNGRGLSVEESKAASCCGMLGMRERASQHRGKIGFDTPTGGGFIVTVVFPVV